MNCNFLCLNYSFLDTNGTEKRILLSSFIACLIEAVVTIVNSFALSEMMGW